MSHLDRIELTGLAFYAYGGVSEAEQSVGQHYRGRIVLFLDLAEAAASDDLHDTVSYAQVYDTVLRIARERPFRLIEALAGRLAAAILHDFPVHRVEVEVRKLLPPIDGVVESAAVILTRERDTS